MKKLLFVFLSSIALSTGYAQQQEIEQLVLNIEKLLQFKQILSDMKEGYDVLVQGYEAVKGLAEGNFRLHEGFLNGLLQVSPSVQQYPRIAQIVRQQRSLVNEYTSAYQRFASGGIFSAAELAYLHRVYTQLMDRSIRQLSDLTHVLTAGQLRMSDDERLQAINAIDVEMADQLVFLRKFSQQADLLSVQRAKARRDIKSIEQLYVK